MIPFNVPPYTGKEQEYIAAAISNKKICGDGEFTRKCSAFIEDRALCKKVLLTTSGTHALDLAAILSGVREGDEVIMPSFTFSSTANAFALRGASIVFVDIRKDTMNMDETLIEDAVTSRTRVIMPMHYAGVACNMDVIMDIAKKHGLTVIEDAAQAVGSLYKGRPCGSIADMGCYSFHETKNYSMGEGGAFLTDNAAYAERAEIIREKGTDRSRFFRGQVDKYTWVDIGSSYLPSELNAAYLYAQLMMFDEIMKDRVNTWEFYNNQLLEMQAREWVELPVIPDGCSHNAHMYYVKTRDFDERTQLIAYMKEHGVSAVFHYVPLHSAKAGKMFGRFHGQDRYTTTESDRLLRLPMYYGLKRGDAARVVEVIYDFYRRA